MCSINMRGKSGERRGKTVRCVNLVDLRQSEHDFSSIVDTLQLLARITFEIDRLELVMLCELQFKITEVGNLVIIRLRRNESEIGEFAPRDDTLQVDLPRTLRDCVGVICSLCEVSGCFRHRLLGV